MIISIILLITTANAILAANITPTETYPHSTVGDDDNEDLYKLYWKLVGKDLDEIQFEVHCKTTGWVGLGLSPNGNMQGDIAIGWVGSDGKSYLQDTNADIKSRPKIDKSQDWFLIEAKELYLMLKSNGYTMLKMKRKLDTCDKEDDLAIKKETNYLQFAWHDKDPVTGNGDWAYHGTNNRMLRVEDLLGFKEAPVNSQVSETENIMIKNFSLFNHPIKNKSTYYYCQFFEYPEFDSDVHMIRYDVNVDKRNKGLVHHLLVHECSMDVLNGSSLFGHECGYVDPPEAIGKCLSSTLIAAWGIGGKKTMSFPVNTGYPVFKNGKKKVFLFEYHYDNPGLETGRLDSTGVSLFYTKKLRQHELGVFILTSAPTALDIQIPPQTENLKLTSICYPECTERFFPQDGITAFTGFLHTHLAGRSVRSLLVRDDKVVQHLFDNPKYDFNYQYSNDIKPTKLYKNDTLILECVYNTKDRKDFTTWGYGTQDEMCMNFVYYYPRIEKFVTCSSQNTPKSFFDFYKSLKKDNLIKIDYDFNEANYYKDAGAIEAYLRNNVSWTDEIRKRFVDYFKNPGDMYAFCGSAEYFEDMIFAKEKKFYVPKEYLKEEQKSCLVNVVNGSYVLSASVQFLFFILALSFRFLY